MSHELWAMRKPMKRKLLILFALGGTVYAATITPDQVINSFQNSQQSGPQRASLSMVVMRPGLNGAVQSTKTVLDIVSDGKEKSLVVVKSPAKMAGQAFLRVGDSMQMYNPAFKKVLPMPPGAQSDGFLGSDLSFGDFTSGDFKTRFTVGKIVQDVNTVTLNLVTKPDAPIPYGGVTLKAKAGTLEPVSITYLDQRGQAVKRISFAAYNTVQGRKYASRLVVDDLIQRGDRTIMEFTSLKYDNAIPAACFTPAAMEKGC